MDGILHSQFQRVEVALGTLVDSIATYNPFPQAAVDLLAADDELSRGLDRLAQHQADHARIQDLRAEADALEEQLKSSVATLASLRRELFETPATTFPPDSRPVPFDELLRYAKNISKYTVPPTYRERIPAAQSNADQDKEGESAAASNGMNTPAQTGASSSAAAQEASKEITEAEGAASQTITAEEAEWLKKLNESQMPWFPWPDNDKIRRSNLMQIQSLLDTGKDPAHEDLTQLKAEEKERIVAEAERAAQTQAPAIEPHPLPAQAAPKPPPPSQSKEEGAGTFAGFGFMDEDDE